MTREWLEAQLGRMVGLRNMPDHSAAYWEALSGFSEDFVAAGIAKAIRTRTFFPAPAELVQDCEQAAPRETWKAEPQWARSGEARTVHIPNPFGGKGITVTVERDWTYFCTACQDSGWRSLWCGIDGRTRKAWHDAATCGRDEGHLEHEWVAQCACWNSNPALLKKRASMSQAAASRTRETA